MVYVFVDGWWWLNDGLSNIDGCGWFIDGQWRFQTGLWMADGGEWCFCRWWLIVDWWCSYLMVRGRRVRRVCISSWLIMIQSSTKSLVHELRPQNSGRPGEKKLGLSRILVCVRSEMWIINILLVPNFAIVGVLITREFLIFLSNSIKVWGCEVFCLGPGLTNDNKWQTGVNCKPDTHLEGGPDVGDIFMSKVNKLMESSTWLVLVVTSRCLVIVQNKSWAIWLVLIRDKLV